MRITAFLPFLLLLMATGAVAQRNKYDRSKEIGLAAGTAYYLGEVNPYKHFGTKMHLGGGITFRNNISKRWTIKLSALYGHIEAWDKDSKDPWIQNRNLNFRNQFFEGGMIFELNFLDYQLASDDWISPYLFTGLTYYSMNPQGNLNGTWHNLRPAGTEGQGTSLGGELYKTTGFSIPAGVGLKLNIYSVFGFSLEWGIRRTWTDYFDDISGTYADPGVLEEERSRLAARLSDQSLVPELENGTNTGLQRGDPGRDDLYIFVLASLNIRIDKKATSCWP